MKALYRTRQWIFSVFVGMVQNKVTKLIRKENALLEVPELLMKNNISKVFVVTTEGFIRRKTLDSLFSLLGEKGIEYVIYTHVTPDPTVEDVDGGMKAYIENGCGAIVAIGGGSVLDCAKIIGARVSNPKTSVRKMRGMLKIKKRLPLYIPVPATCGTGSEVTAAAVISDVIDGEHYKYAVTDLKLIPDIAILDYKLLETLPKFMLVTTTMDALTHSLEAYLNLFASEQVSQNSIESIKLIFENLESAVNNRDGQSLDNLMYASTLAGIAITHNFVGYVHALAHAMGAMYHLPHGYLNSILLPVILKKYESKIEKKMKDLCDYVGIKAEGRYTGSIIEKINELKKFDNLPNYIEELKEEDFEEIIKRADKEANPTYPVPKIFTKKDFKEVLFNLLKH